MNRLLFIFILLFLAGTAHGQRAMSHAYTSILIHFVFSTKDRKPLISEDLQPKLWAYMGGIARANKFKALAIGGIEDHAHVLLSLPGSMAPAKAVQLVKGGSSKWMNDQNVRGRSFAWQDAYGAFTIGISQIEDTVRYINNQKRHHAKMGFDAELKMILRKHGIPIIGEK